MHTYTRVHISLLCELCGSLRLDLWHVIACIDLLFALAGKKAKVKNLEVQSVFYALCWTIEVCQINIG